MLSQLLKISRPRFWMYLFGPYIIGSIATTASLSIFVSWSWWGWAVFWLLPANIWIYGINDWFDRETDAKNPKKDHQEHRFSTKDSWLRWFFCLCVFIFFFGSIHLTGAARMWFLLWIFLGTFYSSPPLRFKTKPVLDAISNTLYVLPGCIAAWQWGGVLVPFWAIIAAGTWSTAMHAFSAVPDIKPDSAAGLKTVATFLGANRTLVFCSILWGVSAWLLIWHQPVWGWFSLIYPVIPLLLLGRSETEHTQAYWRMPWINLLCGGILFWGIFFNRAEDLSWSRTSQSREGLLHQIVGFDRVFNSPDLISKRQ